ncbi:hypothetical protein GY45DRAFT_1330469 [Cubamyces sp. BRFM 1775]|nr:hypothetical protein GY45DRAFT_1330469 [Cubamyces sp. BRFM 1775]
MRTAILCPLSLLLLLCSLLLIAISPYAPWRRNPYGAASDTSSAHSNYTYRSEDFPRAWPLPPLATVYLAHEDSYHYAVDTALGIAEWNVTLPRGGATLYLGDDARPFTLALFHQLRCLNIIREVVVDFFNDPSPDAKIKRFDMIHHCMNYLRQSVICRGNVRLENVRADLDPHLTVWDVTHTCKDWSAVYKAAEDNYDNYLRMVMEREMTM